MKSLKENIEAFQLQAPTRQYRAGSEVLADEMTGYFGENCYWLFLRQGEWKIRDAYNICRGKRIKSFGCLLGILKKM
ncbi:MAG TPA: hypothetical protein VN328_02085 [Thermodesulfovibrionales bacterium]|nr:hypothetical protein [Thermodesulfovibrionales bacterium]